MAQSEPDPYRSLGHSRLCGAADLTTPSYPTVPGIEAAGIRWVSFIRTRLEWMLCPIIAILHRRFASSITSRACGSTSRLLRDREPSRLQEHTTVLDDNMNDRYGSHRVAIQPGGPRRNARIGPHRTVRQRHSPYTQGRVQCQRQPKVPGKRRFIR